MPKKKIMILDPTASPKAGDMGLAPRVPGLGSRTMGIVSNVWRSFDTMAEHFEQEALDRYEVREVMRTVNAVVSSPLPEDSLRMLVSKADAAIVGMGH